MEGDSGGHDPDDRQKKAPENGQGLRKGGTPSRQADAQEDQGGERETPFRAEDTEDSQTTYGHQCSETAGSTAAHEPSIPEPRTPTEELEEVVPEPDHPRTVSVPAPCTRPQRVIRGSVGRLLQQRRQQPVDYTKTTTKTTKTSTFASRALSAPLEGPAPALPTSSRPKPRRTAPPPPSPSSSSPEVWEVPVQAAEPGQSHGSTDHVRLWKTCQGSRRGPIGT